MLLTRPLTVTLSAPVPGLPAVMAVVLAMTFVPLPQLLCHARASHDPVTTAPACAGMTLEKSGSLSPLPNEHLHYSRLVHLKGASRGERRGGTRCGACGLVYAT